MTGNKQDIKLTEVFFKVRKQELVLHLLALSLFDSSELWLSESLSYIFSIIS